MRSTIACLAITATTIALLTVAAPAMATEPEPDTPTYNLFAWQVTSTRADHFATPQTYITNLESDSLDLDQLLPLLPCGTRVQLDAYVAGADADALIGAVLVAPGNPYEPWPGGQYQSSFSRVFTTADCVVVEPPTEPLPPVTPPAPELPVVDVVAAAPELADTGIEALPMFLAALLIGASGVALIVGRNYWMRPRYRRTN